MRMARLGLLLERTAAEKRWRRGVNAFEGYVREILDHAGIPYMNIDKASKWKNGCFDILIALLAEEDEVTLESLMEYVRNGGVLVVYGGLNRLAGKLDLQAKPAFGPGYARLSGEGQDSVPLRFLAASPWAVRGENLEIQTSGSLHPGAPDADVSGPLLLTIPLGKGTIVKWNVPVPDTVVRLQQGTAPVVEDGVAAEDGSGALDEGILKADDCCGLDWTLDRVQTSTGMSFYPHPYADLWREAVIGQLIRTAAERGLTLPMLGYWPEGTRHVAMISHDSDHNLDASAERSLELLNEAGVRSTWCMLEPGYEKRLYDRIRKAGHEVAFHYNALPSDGGEWSEEEFSRQLDAVKADTGGSPIVSNKNHYTRFEGWGELFRWCETYGIEADQTRGPSKKGNIGFLFGTCHPYFPVAWSDEQNRTYNVLEIGFLTQDLDHPTLSDTSVIEPFLESVMKVDGVAHFLFHQIHLYRLPKVAEALRLVAKEAQARGFSFWTCGEINQWTRARRQARIIGVEQGCAMVENAPEGAVVWLPVPGGKAAGQAVEVKFGVPCIKQSAASRS